MSEVQEFDFSVDLIRAILWQYENAEGLQSVLRAKSAWYTQSQTGFWENWIRDVFDLQTANDFGCSVWGVILGVPLSIAQPSTGARPVFGFGVHNKNFTRAGFGRGSAGVAGLTLSQKRLVLRLRYYQLVSDGSAPFANLAIRNVFGRGYVLDGGNMTITYVFPVPLPANVQTVLEEFDLLPRPAGVKVQVLQGNAKYFGFGPNWYNFNRGSFED